MNESGKALTVRLLLTFGAALLMVGAAYGQDQAPASGEKKARHVITEEDLSSGRPISGTSQANATSASSSQDSSGTKADAAASDPAEADAQPLDEETRKHQAGGQVPNESPKDAIKRLEREENELRSKLDSLQQKADSETSENRRRMWLEAIDRQQVTLQEMRSERGKLQKTEEEKAAAGDSGTPVEQPATGTAPQ